MDVPAMKMKVISLDVGLTTGYTEASLTFVNDLLTEVFIDYVGSIRAGHEVQDELIFHYALVLKDRFDYAIIEFPFDNGINTHSKELRFITDLVKENLHNIDIISISPSEWKNSPIQAFRRKYTQLDVFNNVQIDYSDLIPKELSTHELDSLGILLYSLFYKNSI